MVIKVRFNTSREKFEKFGNNMYLCYLSYPQDDDTPNVLAALISKNVGVPVGRVEYAGQDMNKNFIFEVMY